MRTDTWCFGCIMYQLIFGTSPFNTDYEVFELTRNGLNVTIPSLGCGIDRLNVFAQGLRNFLLSTLDTTAENRPNAEAIVYRIRDMLHWCYQEKEIERDCSYTEMPWSCNVNRLMLRMTHSIGSWLTGLDFTWIDDSLFIFGAIASDVAEIRIRKFGVEEINSSMSSMNYKRNQEKFLRLRFKDSIVAPKSDKCIYGYWFRTVTRWMMQLMSKSPMISVEWLTFRVHWQWCRFLLISLSYVAEGPQE